jgi:hypothetical protein
LLITAQKSVRALLTLAGESAGSAGLAPKEVVAHVGDGLLCFVRIGSMTS